MTNDASIVLYLGTDSNRVLVVKEGKVIQSIHPVAPNPLGLPEGVYNGVATEWVSCHPKLPLVYALTSYWNASPAQVTTFQVERDGKLTSVGESSSTGGLHAAHATFSPDGSLYVIAHHNDGKLVFFDCISGGNTALPQNPLLVIETPEVVPGTRRSTGPKDPFPGLPSLHHVQYSSNQKFLLTVDPSQDYIFTYAVNERGLPSQQQPTSQFKCYSDVPIYGLFQRVITQHVLKCQRRARKAVIHPNGKYIYVLYESINRVQVYSIDENGTIDGTQQQQGCGHYYQDLTTLDPSFFTSSPSSWCCHAIGLTLQLAAEIYVTKDGSTLLISNRGDKKLPGGLSRAESSIQVFSIHENGAQLTPQGALANISGPVRHFTVLKDNNAEGESASTNLVAAVCRSSKSYVQFFHRGNKKQTASTSSKDQEPLSHDFHLKGATNVDANVFCIAHQSMAK